MKYQQKDEVSIADFEELVIVLNFFFSLFNQIIDFIKGKRIK